MKNLLEASSSQSAQPVKVAGFVACGLTYYKPTTCVFITIAEFLYLRFQQLDYNTGF